MVKVTPGAEGEIIGRMLWMDHNPSHCKVMTEGQILNLKLIKTENQGGDGYARGGDAIAES